MKKKKKRHHKTSKIWLDRLAKVESPDVTFQGEKFPIVMKKARGMIVVDLDGNRFRDFTACFGVLALGHRSDVTLNAIRKQSANLIHGMGDVHPSLAKIKLLELIAQMTPFQNAKTILSLSGSEAVESALKTAMLVTGRHQFLSFEGGYHGLLLGPLSLLDRSHFRQGFEPWLTQRAETIPFPLHPHEAQFGNETADADFFQRQHGLESPLHCLEQLELKLKTKKFAALVMEPLQGRGGDRLWPDGFVKACAFLAKKYGTLLIFDEVFTGFGRTGKMFGAELHDVAPDLLCLGKALGGGLPLSACVGDVMDVWGKSQGEARHTSTFLGHPLACAVGHATLLHLRRNFASLQQILPTLDFIFNAFANQCVATEITLKIPFRFRGTGFMRGLWFYRSPEGFAAKLADQLLDEGFLVLPSGPRGDVLSFTPPLIATAQDYKKLLAKLHEILDREAHKIL